MRQCIRSWPCPSTVHRHVSERFVIISSVIMESECRPRRFLEDVVLTNRPPYVGKLRESRNSLLTLYRHYSPLVKYCTDNVIEITTLPYSNRWWVVIQKYRVSLDYLSPSTSNSEEPLNWLGCWTPWREKCKKEPEKVSGIYLFCLFDCPPFVRRSRISTRKQTWQVLDLE